MRAAFWREEYAPADGGEEHSVGGLAGRERGVRERHAGRVNGGATDQGLLVVQLELLLLRLQRGGVCTDR